MPNPTPSMPPLPEPCISADLSTSGSCKSVVLSTSMPPLPEPDFYVKEAPPFVGQDIPCYLPASVTAYAQAVADARVREALELAYNAMFAVKGDKATLFDAQTAIRNLSRSLAGKDGTT